MTVHHSKHKGTFKKNIYKNKIKNHLHKNYVWLKSNKVKSTPKDTVHLIAQKWANFPHMVCTPQINKMINNLIKY